MKSPRLVDGEKMSKISPMERQTSILEADFETAISATGFGKFNLILLLIAIPCGWATVFDSTVMSYVLPSVYCDLGLTLQQRGMLNAVNYMGMITSGFLWGFLSDTLGRKKILIAGYGLDTLFIILAGLSQTYEMLLAAKYMSGFAINGPFATLTTLLSEYHGKIYRSKIVLMLGTIYAMANLILPLIAWGTLSRNWHAIFINEKFELRPWNFFILISAIPSTISFISYIFVPESPKFLMTVGKNEEALQVFRKVYSVNSGKPPKSYPIKSLVDEIKSNGSTTITANRSSIKALKEGFQQMKQLFFPPYVRNLVLVCLIQIGFISGVNTLRLWLPQIYTTINDYQNTYPEDTEASLCTMLGSITTNKDVNISQCLENDSKDSVYINVLIVNCVGITSYILAGLVINKVQKRLFIIVLGIFGAISASCMYFAQNVATTTALSSINNASFGICSNVLLSVIIDLFPTALRTIALSVVMVFGRSGAMVGNIIFPLLLELGCWQPFITIGAFMLTCTMVTFFLPKTDLKSLE